MSLNIEKVLFNLKDISDPIIYTEVFLEQIESRNITDAMVDRHLLFEKPVSMKNICNYGEMFELCYALDDVNDLIVIADVLNDDRLILYSAFAKKRHETPQDFNNSEISMNLTHETPYDLIVLSVGDGYKYGHTVTMGEGFFIDFDAYGNPVLITLFRGSKRFKLRHNYLMDSKIKGSIVITDDSIKITISATAKISHESTVRTVEKEISNRLGIPPNEFVLKISLKDM